MALTNTGLLVDVDTSNVISSVAHRDELEELYRVSHPANSFDPRILETSHFYGIRRGTTLVSVAGVHVYSPHYKLQHWVTLQRIHSFEEKG